MPTTSRDRLGEPSQHAALPLPEIKARPALEPAWSGRARFWDAERGGAGVPEPRRRACGPREATTPNFT
jgi:hypothetical protein